MNHFQTTLPPRIFGQVACKLPRKLFQNVNFLKSPKLTFCISEYCCRKFREANMGITNTATASDASSENTTVRAKSPKIWPATPLTKTMGKNTAIVVKVEAATAERTSFVPLTAASRMLSPSSRQRKIDSSTTMELSTSIPTPRASPPSDMMLRETWNRCIGAKVAMMEIGMEIPTMAVETVFLRKKKRTIIARIPPKMAVFLTSSIDFLMKTD